MKPDPEFRFLAALTITAALWPFYIFGSILITILLNSITMGCLSVVILYFIALMVGWFSLG